MQNSDMVEERHYNNAGQLHRDDGPAVVTSEGDQNWYQNGELHRNDGGPSYIEAGGECASFYEHGLLMKVGQLIDGKYEICWERGDS